MARVHLTHYEVEHDLLPPVCVRCGAPAVDRVVQTVYIIDGWGGVIPFFGAMIGLFVLPPLLPLSLRLARAVHVRVPYCEPHRDVFNRRHWAEWRILIPAWTFAALTVDGFLIGSLISDGPGFVCAAPLIVMFVGVWSAIWLARNQVKITNVDKTGVRLSGVDETFASALAEERARDRVSNPDRRGGHGDMRDDYDDEPG